MERKLLYHRGVDDQAATYITDYIEAAIGFVFGTHLLLLVCFPKYKELDGKELEARKEASSSSAEERSTRNTIAVIVIQYSIAGLALVGGLVHQFLQEVEDYQTWKDDWTWLIVWRVASSFSALTILGFLFIAQQILIEEEAVKFTRRKSLCFWTATALLCGCTFVHSLAMMAHATDPWSVLVAFILSYLGAIISFFMVAAANHWTRVQGNRIAHEDGDRNDSKEEEPESAFDKYRIDLKLHLAAPFLFAICGVVNFVFVKMGCATDKEESECPLPLHFNHNALLHIMVIPVCFLYFLAELLAIKRRQRRRRRTEKSHDTVAATAVAVSSSDI